MTFISNFWQDKNRDVIMCFPDVDPNSIFTSLHLSLSGKHHKDHRILGRRATYEQTTYSYTHPHQWYSTSEVIRALKLFIAGGDQLYESNTYRFQIFAPYHTLLLKKRFVWNWVIWKHKVRPCGSDETSVGKVSKSAFLTGCWSISARWSARSGKL